MRNKIFMFFAMAVCGASSSALYAGSMGPVESPSFIPFVSGEGLYSWPNIAGLTIFVPPDSQGLPVNKNQGWGGRIGAGVMHPVSNRFAISGEAGWGYYGHTGMTVDYAIPLSAAAVGAGVGNTSANLDRWGFDLLGGLLYTQPKFDLYAKGGALFQNMRVDLSGVVLISESSTVTLHTTLPEVLPEIKLGGAYHITDKLAATASWMYVFGGNFDINLPYINVNASHIGALVSALQSPSMNTVMFGLEYRFV